MNPATYSLDSMLIEGAEMLGVGLDESQRARLLAYLKYFIQWNSIYNLSAIRDPQQMLIQHILDSLAIVPVLSSCPISSVLDIGSGGGLPGVVLAISKPDWRVILNDAVQKKTAFLTHLKTVLPLPNVQVLASRVELLPSSDGERIAAQAKSLQNVLVSRAFSSLSRLVSLTRHLVAPGVSIWAMKGVFPEAEISEFKAKALDGMHIARVVKLHVPFLKAERHLVQITCEPAHVGARG